MFNTRECDLRKLNSMTKYPSIPTYHKLGQKGRLTEELNCDFSGETVIATEKIDGENSRLILLPDNMYVIGSREELLYGRGDLIESGEIVKTLKPIGDRMQGVPDDHIMVLFFETFGGKTTAGAKQYTSDRSLSCRLFDAVKITNYRELFEMPLEKTSSWRQHGGQEFAPEHWLTDYAPSEGLQLAPRITLLDGAIPTDIEQTLKCLQSVIPQTHVALDDNAKGNPEGLVARTPDRSQIAKLRFEDYNRTLRAKK